MSTRTSIFLELSQNAQVASPIQLSDAVAGLCGLDPTDTGPRYTHFMPIGVGPIRFYQGASGEDSYDGYEAGLRIFCSPEDILNLLVQHLTQGRFMLIYVPEGDGAVVYTGTPGHWTNVTADLLSQLP